MAALLLRDPATELPLGTRVAVLDGDGREWAAGRLELYRLAADGRRCWVALDDGGFLGGVPAARLRAMT